MQETSLQSCKAQIKIFAYPGLASLLRSRFWDVTQRSPQRNGCYGLA